MAPKATKRARSAPSESVEELDTIIMVNGQRSAWSKLGKCLKGQLPRSVPQKCVIRQGGKNTDAKIVFRKDGQLILTRDAAEKWDDVPLKGLMYFELCNERIGKLVSSLFHQGEQQTLPTHPDVSDDEVEFQDSIVGRESIGMVQQECHRESNVSNSTEMSEMMKSLKEVCVSMNVMKDSVSRSFDKIDGRLQLLENRQTLVTTGPSNTLTNEALSNSLAAPNPTLAAQPPVYHLLDMEVWRRHVAPLESFQRKLFIRGQWMKNTALDTNKLEGHLEEIDWVLDLAVDMGDKFWAGGSGIRLLAKKALLIYYLSHKDILKNVFFDTFYEDLRLSEAFSNPKTFNDVVNRISTRYSKNFSITCSACQGVGHLARECPTTKNISVPEKRRGR